MKVLVDSLLVLFVIVLAIIPCIGAMLWASTASDGDVATWPYLIGGLALVPTIAYGLTALLKRLGREAKFLDFLRNFSGFGMALGLSLIPFVLLGLLDSSGVLNFGTWVVAAIAVGAGIFYAVLRLLRVRTGRSSATSGSQDPA